MSDSLDAVVQARRSVRGFTDKPVPRETLEEVLALAQQSPSNCNVQPWRVYVAEGEVRDRLVDAYVSAMTSGEASQRGLPVDAFQGGYRDRQVACAKELYGKMGVERGDREGRFRAEMRNFQLFDAPQVAFVCMERDFGIGVALDVGMWVQTFMLLLHSRGIGSCAQAALRAYSEKAHEIVGIPENLQILCAVSFGYEDPSVPANNARQPRDPFQLNVQFVG